MNGVKRSRRTFSLFLVVTVMIVVFIALGSHNQWHIQKPHRASGVCPRWISEETITPLNNTKHLLVSAFVDRRVEGFDIRIIGIFRRDSIKPLHCLFCCQGCSLNTSPATVYQHSDNFGFPFVTTDVMCQIPPNCSATHVTLLTDPHNTSVLHRPVLPIRNMREEERKLQFNFTVCISNLYGDYNNVVQFAQTLEMYRVLGVDRVVIYNISCGPDLDRLLQSYSGDSLVEMVPWPIDRHLKPSRGWLFSEFGGDLHYYGQLTTLNECIYRSMERSRYVLLNDIDEIVMPYKHEDLMSLMETLQRQQPDTGVFLIESHVFPKNPFPGDKNDQEPSWRGVPGFNILERIHRHEPEIGVFHNNKMMVRPRSVEQTSVHNVLKMFGKTFMIPSDVCRLIHSPTTTQKERPLDQIHVDTRLRDFKQKVLPRVIEVLSRAGLLGSEGPEMRGS